MTASCDESEKNVERIRTSPKRRIGKLSGLRRKVILFSTTTLIPQRTKSNSEPMTINICFGNVKKSVVMVRKKRGNKRNNVDVIIVAADDRSDKKDLLIYLAYYAFPEKKLK